MYLSHLTSLTGKEKKYTEQKCKEILGRVGELPERDITKLNNRVGVRVANYMGEPSFELNAETGFSVGAVLKLFEINKELTKIKER